MVSRVSSGSASSFKAALDSVKDGGKATSTDNTITLAKGDTLYGLAKKHLGDGSKWRQLADANGIKDPTKLAIGTKIAIPESLQADQLEKGALTAQRKAIGASNSTQAPNLGQTKPEGTVNVRDLHPVVIPGSGQGKAKLGETKQTQLHKKSASYTRENGQWNKNEAATKAKVEKSWKDNVSAEATIAKVGSKAEGSLAGAKAEHIGESGDHIKNARAEIHAGYGSAEAQASAGLSLDKDGLKANVGAKAGVEVSAVHAEASAKTKTYSYGAAGTSTSASAKGDLLAADAKVGAKAEIDLKKGDANISAEASAGAYLAKGEVKVKQHAAYIDNKGKEHNLGSVGVGAEGQVGIGASASASVGMDDWKFKIKASAGLCVGVGGKVNGEIEVDLKGVYNAGKDAANYTAAQVSKGAAYVEKKAYDAADYVSKQASSAASALSNAASSTYNSVSKQASSAASAVSKAASSTYNYVASWF